MWYVICEMWHVIDSMTNNQFWAYTWKQKLFRTFKHSDIPGSQLLSDIQTLGIVTKNTCCLSLSSAPSEVISRESSSEYCSTARGFLLSLLIRMRRLMCRALQIRVSESYFGNNSYWLQPTLCVGREEMDDDQQKRHIAQPRIIVILMLSGT